MTRCSYPLSCVVVLYISGVVDAQHHHGNNRSHGDQGASRPYLIYPAFGVSGMSGMFHSAHHGHRFAGPVLLTAYVPQPLPVVSYASPINTIPYFMPFPSEPIKGTTTPSTAAARMKSLELQAKGDERMRDQKWSEARAAYNSAVIAAPDRAMAHLKLGVCYATIQRFDSAIREIKRALRLDPNLPKTAEKLETLFGPNSKIIRNSVVSKIAEWVRDDNDNPDKLFLYGVVLYLERDPRARETLEAAWRNKTSGDINHITLLLKGGENDLGLDGFPKLNDRPMPRPIAPSNLDLRFPKAPIPMPDGPFPMP